jgi:acyl-CoA synthetase (AMP-forming)/AMP-acid ligase II
MHLNASSYLSKRAVDQPLSTAIVVPARNSFLKKTKRKELSFSELDLKTGLIANHLRAMGVNKGSRVLMMVKPGLDLIQIVFALLKLGAIPIVIDPGMGLARFFQSASEAKADFIIGQSLAILIAKLNAGKMQTVERFIALNNSFKRQVNALSDQVKVDPVSVEANDLAAILFTSGSTGPAKGVCYTHGIFSAQIKLIQEQYGICPGEVDLPMLPVFALFNPAFGTCTVVPDMNPSRPASVNPKKIVESILENNVTYSFGSPAIWSNIVSYCEAFEISLPSLKRVMMAGAPVPQSLLVRLKEFLPNGEIFTPYGATEALPVSSISASEIIAKQIGEYKNGRKGICVGRAFPGIFIKVIQPIEGAIETLADTKTRDVGMLGEIIVSGPSVTRAYDSRVEATKMSKIKDSDQVWHRMGDMGWLDTEGYLWFCGRKAERVETDKGLFETVCCEAVFNELDFVARSALVQVGDEASIIVEPIKGKFPRDEATRSKLRGLLRKRALEDPLTKRIEHFYFEEHFPVDVRHNAKINRLSLAKKFSSLKAAERD